MNKKNFILGASEIALGLFLISPADEALITSITAGAGAVVSPVQLPLSAIFGAALCYDGLNRI